ncbi:MAG: hypothetical protein M3414_04065 [Pseudomonadota bacterium]|nr:hypothetical protein [Pseudomonadota bacterium]
MTDAEGLPGPAPAHRHRVLQDGATGRPASIVIVADNAPGRYQYGIRANGIMVDPAIIIDR